MNSRRQKATQAIAIFLVFAVFQVYVRASLTNSSVSAKEAAVNLVVPAGMLIVGGNTPVTLDGNSADTGTTIFSGARLQTPDGVPANVRLGSVTRLDMAPNTNLTLAFDKGRVAINLLAGNVVLTTDKGISGSVTTPDGLTARTDSSVISTIIAPAAAAAASADPAKRGSGGRGGLFGLGKAGTIALIAAAASAVIIPVAVHERRKHKKEKRCRDAQRNENNPSESEPDNDEDCQGQQGFQEGNNQQGNR